MSDSLAGRMGPSPNRAASYGQQSSSTNLADILERVLDKGVVIAGDIQINLLDIELLTIKLRLLVVSVDKAKEMGIDWWEHDPSLSSRASQASVERTPPGRDSVADGDGRQDALTEENQRLREEVERLRSAAELPAGERPSGERPAGVRPSGERPARKERPARRERPERPRRPGDGSGGERTRRRGE